MEFLSFGQTRNGMVTKFVWGLATTDCYGATIIVSGHMSHTMANHNLALGQRQKIWPLEPYEGQLCNSSFFFNHQAKMCAQPRGQMFFYNHQSLKSLALFCFNHVT